MCREGKERRREGDGGASVVCEADLIAFSFFLAGHQSPRDRHSSTASLKDSAACHHYLWCHTHLWSKCGK